VAAFTQCAHYCKKTENIFSVAQISVFIEHLLPVYTGDEDCSVCSQFGILPVCLRIY